MSNLESVVILFHALIGIAGGLSVTFFLWGFVLYIVRLGTERRVQGIHIMEWGVAFIFAAVILIGILRLVQHLFR